MKRLAIIPARGGSKRIPNKNIRDFCGQPMITHVLGAARDRGLFSSIHVSTESQSIREVATTFGFQPDFSRPESLADDQTPIMPVLHYVTEEYARRGQHFDEIWLLTACAPLIKSGDVIAAASLFLEKGSNSPVLAVAEYSVPIEWAFRRSKEGLLKAVQSGMFAVRSQDIEKAYFDSGSFAVFPSSRILSSAGAGSDKDFIGYVLSKNSAIDIDDEEDWKLAESLFSIIKGRQNTTSIDRSLNCD